MYASSDVTSSTLAWVITALAVYPKWQDRLRKEVWKHLGENFSTAKFTEMSVSACEDINRFILECWRMVPVAPATVSEITHREYTLGDYTVPAGTEIQVDLWSLHRSEKNWANPYKFNPDRFCDPDYTCRFNRYGYGTRKCLGQNFANVLLPVVVQTLLLKAKISLVPTKPPASSESPQISSQSPTPCSDTRTDEATQQVSELDEFLQAPNRTFIFPTAVVKLSHLPKFVLHSDPRDSQSVYVASMQNTTITIIILSFSISTKAAYEGKSEY